MSTDRDCLPISTSPSTLQRSRYNFFVDRNVGVMGFNARTGVFALLADDVAGILKNPDADVSLVRDVDTLVEFGFLHDGSELDRIVSKYAAAKAKNNRLALTLVPTLACNFACEYCYQTEYRKSKVMSAETQTAALRLVREMVSAGRVDVSCTWYGGEPLLCKDIVLRLSAKLREAVEESGGAIKRMNIITNGTRLTEETACALAAAGVASAQVSLDSLIYEAPKKRGVICRDGSASPILTNLLTAADHLKVKIRINVGPENLADVDQIMRILEDNGLRHHAYLARVHDLDGEAGCTTHASGHKEKISDKPLLPVLQPTHSTLSRRDFADFEQKKCLNGPSALSKVAKRLTPRTHFCSATANNLYVVDPAGYVSRCWHSAGCPSEAMGNVQDLASAMDTSAVAKRWDRQNPFTYATCRSCRVLPLCMGGCSHPRVFMGSQKSPCESIRFQIDESVEMLGRRLPVPDENTSLDTVSNQQ